MLEAENTTGLRLNILETEKLLQKILDVRNTPNKMIIDDWSWPVR